MTQEESNYTLTGDIDEFIERRFKDLERETVNCFIEFQIRKEWKCSFTMSEANAMIFHWRSFLKKECEAHFVFAANSSFTMNSKRTIAFIFLHVIGRSRGDFCYLPEICDSGIKDLVLQKANYSSQRKAFDVARRLRCKVEKAILCNFLGHSY